MSPNRSSDVLRLQRRILVSVLAVTALLTASCGGDVPFRGEISVVKTASVLVKHPLPKKIKLTSAQKRHRLLVFLGRLAQYLEAIQPPLDTPPTWICMRESHCTPGIVSTHYGCSGWHCYGKWQFDPTTFRSTVRNYHLTGIPEWPLDSWSQVTPLMEDRVAAALWDHGRGCGHWAAC